MSITEFTPGTLVWIDKGTTLFDDKLAVGYLSGACAVAGDDAPEHPVALIVASHPRIPGTVGATALVYVSSLSRLCYVYSHNLHSESNP